MLGSWQKTGARAGIETQLGDFTTDTRVLVVAAMAVVVATAAVGASWILLRLITLITNLAYHGRLTLEALPITATGSLPPVSVLIPVAGCLIIGLMARYGSEKIRGHGIPEAMEAILIGQSRIQPRVAFLKPLSSAISIGTGGPFGAEGPIIMTGGALGSLFAQMFMMSAVERKTLLVAGAAAGMTAIFGTPVAAVLLAVELLLFEWKPRSFLPVVVAAVVAQIERSAIAGVGPLFPFAGSVTISGINALGWTAIGIAAGFGSGFLTMLVYAAEDAFQKLPIHWMWWPIVGGVVIGIGGLIEPQALGVGYDNIRALLAGDMAGHAAFVLLAVKAVIWAVALGSGTSGGVLAPLLIMGGTLGVLSGPLLPSAPPGFWALLGMTAMMGGTMRSPLTSPLFAAELTGDYAALLPLLTASAASYAVTVLLLKRSILTEKIARRGLHVLREYHVDPFDMTRVRDVMVKAVDTLPVGMKISEAADFFTTEEPRHKTYPVVDGLGKAVGIVSRADVLRWLREKNEPFTVLAESTQGQAMCVCSPDDLVGALADRMIAEGHGHLPVVEPEGGTLVGFVARQDLLHARARMKAEESEHSRSLGWDCAKFRRRAARRG